MYGASSDYQRHDRGYPSDPSGAGGDNVAGADGFAPQGSMSPRQGQQHGQQRLASMTTSMAYAPPPVNMAQTYPGSQAQATTSTQIYSPSDPSSNADYQNYHQRPGLTYQTHPYPSSASSSAPPPPPPRLPKPTRADTSSSTGTATSSSMTMGPPAPPPLPARYPLPPPPARIQASESPALPPAPQRMINPYDSDLATGQLAPSAYSTDVALAVPYGQAYPLNSPAGAPGTEQSSSTEYLPPAPPPPSSAWSQAHPYSQRHRTSLQPAPSSSAPALPSLKFLSNPDIPSEYSGITGEPLPVAGRDTSDDVRYSYSADASSSNYRSFGYDPSPSGYADTRASSSAHQHPAYPMSNFASRGRLATHSASPSLSSPTTGRTHKKPRSSAASSGGRRQQYEHEHGASRRAIRTTDSDGAAAALPSRPAAPPLTESVLREGRDAARPTPVAMSASHGALSSSPFSRDAQAAATPLASILELDMDKILQTYTDLRDALPHVWSLLPADPRAPIQPTKYLQDHPWEVVPLKQAFHLAVTGFSLLHPGTQGNSRSSAVDSSGAVSQESMAGPLVPAAPSETSGASRSALTVPPGAPVATAPMVAASDQIIGSAACLGCGATDTPEWRRGPLGPRTLCNACGLVFAKLVRKRAREAAKAAAIAAGTLPPKPKRGKKKAEAAAPVKETTQ